MSDQHWEYFTYDGVKSSTYGVWISGEDTFTAPDRDVEIVQIPGRNGTLTLDNGRYNNVTITYPCFMVGDFLTGFSTFKGAIFAKKGFLQLTDTYHPDGFRLARLTKGTRPKPGPYNRSAAFTLTFDCYPQFYLDSGQSYTTVANNGTISNPTNFDAKPLIQVTFSTTPRDGTVTVNGETITFNAMGGTNVYVDCEDQNAYRISGQNEVISQNGRIALTTGAFPELKPGSNTVAYTGNISSVKIMPRWWTL